MRFAVLDDDEDGLSPRKNQPIKRMVLSAEKVSNGYILEIGGLVYVFQTLNDAISFVSEEMTKNYEAGNGR